MQCREIKFSETFLIFISLYHEVHKEESSRRPNLLSSTKLEEVIRAKSLCGGFAHYGSFVESSKKKIKDQSR